MYKRRISNGEVDELDFEAQTAIVTGGGSGIGRAVAQALSNRGANLILSDIDLDAAEAVAQSLPGRAMAIQTDVAKPEDADRLIQHAIQHFGAIDILVHSAGVGLECEFLKTSDETWRRLIDIDLSGTFYVNRSAGRHMKAEGYGRIVNISSTAGLVGGTGRAAYGAAKGGVIMLTRVLAVELGRSGVTVNAVAPGAIDTELVARMHTDRTRRTYKSGIPLDRYGTPEEVAYPIAFLCSREASYITGEVLAIDGGFLAAGVMQKEGVLD